MPRVLGIGNVTKNAFKNAVALRSIGVECDVLCNDYYHATGCPEWETDRFQMTGFNFDAPNWSATLNRDSERPRWFAQGTMSSCIDYLIAKNSRLESADELWRQLREESAISRLGTVPKPTEMRSLDYTNVYRDFSCGILIVYREPFSERGGFVGTQQTWNRAK